MTAKRSALTAANRLLAPLSLRLEKTERLAVQQLAEMRLSWLAVLAEEHPAPIVIPRAQLGQDLFALWATSFSCGGFFVEFGAADGVGLSNTFLLERSFGWNGIVGEPARVWHEQLRRNRTCIVDTRCVWSHSGEQLVFAETADPSLSTVREFVDVDGHREHRRDATEYPVETVSLNDLLEEHAAPRRIDYLSVDTEGTESEILEAFDFTRWEVAAVTVEHADNSARRDRVHSLLTTHGFERVFEDISAWDDWFINPSLGIRRRSPKKG